MYHVGLYTLWRGPDGVREVVYLAWRGGGDVTDDERETVGLRIPKTADEPEFAATDCYEVPSRVFKRDYVRATPDEEREARRPDRQLTFVEPAWRS